MHNVPLRVALDILLKSLVKPATYRVENGVYKIIPKAAWTRRTAGCPIETIAATLVTVDAEQVRSVLRAETVFAQVKVNYTLDPTLRSIPVTAHLINCRSALSWKCC